MAKKLDRRKLDHIQIVRKESVEPLPSPFARYRLPTRALPELDWDEVDTSTSFLGRTLNFPFLISSMTGGPELAGSINQNLAVAAETGGVALALGSMRILLEQPELASSFKVRALCPSVPLLANLGLVQLNYGIGHQEINRLVDIIEADGIFLHVNPIQEVIQPEGDRNFKGLIARLAELIPKVKVPVLIKEVGAGIDPESARRLVDIGVRWIDVGGAGGTSWAQVEGYRRKDRLGMLFKGVGLETDEALIEARGIKDACLIGSGGLRSGLDLALVLMLGARLGAAARPFLEPALEGAASCCQEVALWQREFKTAMFCVGAASVDQLRLLEPKLRRS